MSWWFGGVFYKGYVGYLVVNVRIVMYGIEISLFFFYLLRYYRYVGNDII